MPALNFKKQFAEAVENGLKRQTIRAPRMDCRNPQPGQPLYLYTGMRTKSCRKLGEAVCTSVEQIYISEQFNISLARDISTDEEDGIIEADGFTERHKFFEFFFKTHGLPFNGFLIKWELKERQNGKHEHLVFKEVI